MNKVKVKINTDRIKEIEIFNCETNSWDKIELLQEVQTVKFPNKQLRKSKKHRLVKL